MKRPDTRTIAKRAHAATKPPWGWDAGDIGQDYSVPYCEVFTRPDEEPIAQLNYQANGGEQDKQARANAEFIAHARADIPALINYIKYLEGRQ